MLNVLEFVWVVQKYDNFVLHYFEQRPVQNKLCTQPDFQMSWRPWTKLTVIIFYLIQRVSQRL